MHCYGNIKWNSIQYYDTKPCYGAGQCSGFHAQPQIKGVLLEGILTELNTF